MQRWKAFACSAVLVLAVSLAAGFLHSRAYPVAADGSNLPQEIAHFLSRGQQMWSEEDFRFHGTVDIGAKRFVLMELAGAEFDGQSLGMVRLERGWNGTYRIDSVSRGGGNFRNEAVESDDGWYLIFGGRNAHFGIHSAEFRVEGEESYTAEIPQTDRFLMAVELGREPELKHLLPVDQIRFYDADGRDITEEVPWN